MQKLTTKLKNVPVDAPQVLCSTRLGLNRDQSLSDQCSSEKNNSSKKNEQTNNNLEVDLPVRENRLGLRVPVTGKPGKLVLKSSSYKNSSFISNEKH